MVFRAHQQVQFGDIDYAGIVYYPRFLHYLHVALEEFFGSEIGIDYPTVLKKHRIGFPTVHLELDFQKPLQYADRIEVEIDVIDMGKSSITWGYRVYLSGEEEMLAVHGSTITATINMDTFEKTEIPQWLREKLEEYRQGKQEI